MNEIKREDAQVGDIDLAEAIDAAARAAFTDCVGADEATGADLWVSDRVRVLLNNADDWRQAITAALPHIERQIREQLAHGIEAARGPQWARADETPAAFAIRAVRDKALTAAARIARSGPK